MLVSNAAEFGSMIRAARRALGYTQAEVALACGACTTYLSNLENGKETAELGKALPIAQMLGVDLEARSRSGTF